MLDLWRTTSASSSKLYAYNTSMGNSRFNISDVSTQVSPGFLRAQNTVRVKIISKWSEGKQKLLRVSGRFELSRVRVTEGKITVNVWRKSRGNRFWFKLARFRVIGSQVYIHMKDFGVAIIYFIMNVSP